MAFAPENFYQVSNNARGPKVFQYFHTDAVTAVRVSGYIPYGDAADKENKFGITNGSLVIYTKTDASPVTVQLMIANVNDTTRVIDLSDGTAITSTNTD